MTEHDQPEGSPAFVPRRILVVEDDPGARDAVQRYLQYLGYNVDCCAGADEAIRWATRHPPAVVICDWQLGDRYDGVTVAEILQRRFGTGVILVTAHGLSDLRRRAGNVRVASFFRKPVTLNALADALSRELRR
jgi:CheY-like chemotaxis protein